MTRSVTWSKTFTFFEDDWHEGNAPIMGVRTHATWLTIVGATVRAGMPSPSRKMGPKRSTTPGESPICATDNPETT